MADPPTHPDTRDDGGQGEHGDDRDGTGTPRWVKVFGLIALVIVLIFLILLFARGHGPPVGGH